MTRDPGHAALESPPLARFGELQAVWFQITGTLCNLACRHCFNTSGPRDPWLAALDADVVRRYLAEAAALGVREVYLTGGEPFLHPEIVPLLAASLTVAPTTVLTNGTLVDARMADRLAGLAAASTYSLEVRISVDAPTAEANDRIRGRGAFDQALRAARLLSARGLYPIVTATDVTGEGGLYERLRSALLAAGLDRPRIKILPLLPFGRAAGRTEPERLTAADLEGFDWSRLPCTESRAVAAGGIYACPILAGLPTARVGTDRLADALQPVPLAHPICATCCRMGVTCRNY